MKKDGNSPGGPGFTPANGREPYPKKPNLWGEKMPVIDWEKIKAQTFV